MTVLEKDKSDTQEKNNKKIVRKMKLDNEELKIDSVLLTKKTKDIDEIFSVYINIINPLIVQYEVLANNFPSEILNEIRAIFTHLGRCTITSDDKVINDNLSKAKGHAKRAALDCYKYNCLAYSDFYSEFMKHYKNVDLSLIDNGKFLPEITKKYFDAQELVMQAKMCETNLVAGATTSEIYEKYENAYLAYNKVYLRLIEVQEVADNFLNRLVDDKEKANKRQKVDRFFAVIGVIVGIIGIIIGFI